jgi:hypothetical protein
VVLRPLDPDDPGDRDLVVAVATHAGVRWRRATRGAMSLNPTDVMTVVRSSCSYLFAVETGDDDAVDDVSVHGIAAVGDVDQASGVAAIDLVVGPGPDAAAVVAAHAGPAVRELLAAMPLRRLYLERFADEPFPFPDDAHRWEREVAIPGFATLDGVPTAYETWATTPERWED